MAIQSQPSRIPEPFAGSGTKNTIPATNTAPSASQAASWASGFPPECSQPISAGGCPVPRNDMNGALNWLSQGFAFNQDGGIWTWSALADYAAGRMVRGSNGRLYWSVAQSGPNTSAGAKDPTADTAHTYWNQLSTIDSSGLVHIAGAETITGQKTFSSVIVGTATKSEGIAQFSSAANYTYADLVMDSNGVLYFAAQASGPGTAAGVKNPATDDGTYWTTLLSQTPSLSDKSKRAANTSWVKDIASAPVYMNPNGSDSNDGMSAASPVKTFAKAIGIGFALPHGSFTIVAVGGDYYGDVWVSDRKNCTLEIQGDTTIHGTLNVTQNSSLLVKTSGHSFSVDGQVNVSSSHLFINGTFYIGYSGSGSEDAIYVERNSSFYVNNGITATVTNASNVINCSLNSSVFISGAVSATANNIQKSVFSTYNGSIIVFGAGVTLAGAGNKYAFVSETRSGIAFSGNATNVYVPEGTVTDSAVRIADSGFMYFSDSLTGVSLASPYAVVSCQDNSYAYFGCTTTLRKTGAGGVAVGCYNGSLVHLPNTSAILYIIGTTHNVALYASYGSKIIVECNLNIFGDYANAVVVCFGLSVFKINYQSTVTNNATGAKFYVSNLSMIDTGGAGTNRLPGDTPGTTDSATFGVYN